jgi:hypothetical protein
VTPIFPYRKALFADARPVLASGTPYFSVDQGLGGNDRVPLDLRAVEEYGWDTVISS